MFCYLRLIVLIAWLIVPAGINFAQEYSSLNSKLYTLIISAEQEIHSGSSLVILSKTIPPDKEAKELAGVISAKEPVLSFFLQKGLDTSRPAAELIVKLADSNNHTKKIKGNFPDSLHTILVSTQRISKLFRKHRKNAWDHFYKTFSEATGIISFSPIVFSDDKNDAICYFEIRKGNLNASGNLVFFENINGEWKIKSIFKLWVS